MQKQRWPDVWILFFSAIALSWAAADDAGNWTWITGSTNRNQYGAYGIKGVPAPGNAPGTREYPAAWNDDAGALWVFGGYGLPAVENNGYLNDLWKLDPATTNWVWMTGSTNRGQAGVYGVRGVPHADNTPGAHGHCAEWSDGAGAFWLCGGSGYDSAGNLGNLNHLWKFDPATTNWTWVKGAHTNGQPGTYGSQGVPDADNTPGARYGAAAWIDGDGMFWMFGGYGLAASGGHGCLNDLWKFDPATTNWAWIKGANITNQPGVYGVQGVPHADNTPGARRSAVSWTDDAGHLWLFGGCSHYGSQMRLNDLWKFDPATTNWAWIKGANVTNQPGVYGVQGVPHADNTPGAREVAVSWHDHAGALWLCGGFGLAASGGYGYLNDLWTFDPATANWAWIKGANVTNQPGAYGVKGQADASNTPGARCNAAGCNADDRALWLFGGYGLPSIGLEGRLNDVWKFNPASGRIALSTNTLGFDAVFQGDNPASRIVFMTNAGTAAFAFSNAIAYGVASAAWLTVTPGSGNVSTGGVVALTNAVSIAGLDAGIYRATNQITADHACNSPQYIVIQLQVHPAGQCITFPAIADQLLSGRVALSATASSGLPVHFDVGAGPAVITDGSNLAFTATGAVSIVASQPGNVNWMAAPGVTNTFNVVASPIQPPDVPAAVSATAGVFLDKVRINWSVTAGATSYQVWRNTANDPASAVMVGAVAAPVGRNAVPDAAWLSDGRFQSSPPLYDDTTVGGETTYYYWVKAVNSGGTSAFSAVAAGYPGVIGPLAGVNGLIGDNVQVVAGTPLTITVEMMNLPANYIGHDVDWWLAAYAHAGGAWYYLNRQMLFIPFDGDLANIQPAYQGPLANLPSYIVARDIMVAPGVYNVWFAVDYPMDGVLHLIPGRYLMSRVTLVVE